MSGLEWLLHPAAQYAGLAAGLGLCLYLFLTLKHDLHSVEARRRESERQLLDAVRRHTEEINSRVREVEEWADLLAPPAPPQSGLNLTKRNQVLRMHRQGEAPRQIAGALGLPLNEVELLLKVHQIILETVG
jgi:hypothetical protein